MLHSNFQTRGKTGTKTTEVLAACYDGGSERLLNSICEACYGLTVPKHTLRNLLELSN